MPNIGVAILILSVVPVIVVFTKYDILVGRIAFEMARQMDEEKGMSWPQIMERATLDAPLRLQEICIDPFKQRVGVEIPHVTVSSELTKSS